MNILIDIGHPAHVHLYRNAAVDLVKRGHKIVIAVRDRGIICELLKSYGLDYVIASKAKTSRAGLALELIEHDWHILKLTIKHDIDILLGSSVSISHVSCITKARSIVLSEDDADYVKTFSRLTYPFCDTIVIPDCLRDNLTAKHVTHNSYHELAYLHPNHFTPDPTVLTELQLVQGEAFFLLRLVAFKAHHDFTHRGLKITTIRTIIELLSAKGKVFVSSEGDVPEEFRQYEIHIPSHRMHHAMYYAVLLVSDSQTMTIEAAVLGTPAIRCNSFVGRCSVIQELEHKYALAYSFLPDNTDQMLQRIAELLNMPDLDEQWNLRREKLLQDKIDAANWITDFVEHYPQSRDDVSPIA